MDQTLKCVDCGKEFVFTEGEQKFYLEKKFVNAQGEVNKPVRCKECRDAKRNSFPKKHH